jgi:hypothetical protein
VLFPGGERLVAGPPATGIDGTLPKSYQSLLRHHDTLELEKAQLWLGEHGHFDPNGWIDSEQLLGIVSEKIVTPLWDYSDCWLYHPTEKNVSGEPKIYFLSHEGAAIDSPQTQNAGAVFVRRVAENLDVVEVAPRQTATEPESPAPSSNLTFEQSLRRQADPLGEAVIGDPYTATPAAFIAALEGIDFKIDGLHDIIAQLTNDTLIRALKFDETSAPRLLNAYLALSMQNVSSKLAEELAGNALFYVMRPSVDANLTKRIFDTMIPPQVRTPRLAYNLACWHARRQGKAKMMEYARLAISKGQALEKFRQDIDFKPFLTDADFAKLIGVVTEASPVEEELADWWFNLPAPYDDMFKVYVRDKSEESVRRFVDNQNHNFQVSRATTLEPLRRLTGIKKLSLSECTAPNLAPLAGLVNIQEFRCDNMNNPYMKETRFTDIGPLKGWTKLERLHFGNQGVEDVSPLRGLFQMKYLQLQGNPVRDFTPLQELNVLEGLFVTTKNSVDITVFSKLEKLTDLSVSGKIASLEGLRSLTKLSSLWINADAAQEPLSLEPLSALKNLHALDLYDTPITGLEPLYGLYNLQRLGITASKVTPALKKELKAKMPQCKVG